MQTRITNWLWPSVVLTLLLGTGARADPPQSGQGIRLHGTGRFERVNISIASANRPHLLSPSLRGPHPKCGHVARVSKGVFTNANGDLCHPDYLKGWSFTAPLGGQLYSFTLKDSRKHFNTLTGKPDPDLLEYKVTWQNLTTKETGDLCNKAGTDAENYALPVPHAWTASGEMRLSEEHFTFACVPKLSQVRGEPRLKGGGVIAKCIDWGYPPWANTPKDAPSKAAEEQAAMAVNHHQACVRMATADYCGEGKANTLDGTPIAWYPKDKFPKEETALRRRDPIPGEDSLPSGEEEPDGSNYMERIEQMLSTQNLGDFKFEAVWGVDGCGRAQALCISKERWESLPTDGVCSQLKKESERCKKMTLEQLRESNALFVSYSTQIDRGLYLFKQDSQYITTTRVKKAVKPGASPSIALEGAGGNSPSLFGLLNESSFVGIILSSNKKQSTQSAAQARVQGTPRNASESLASPPIILRPDIVKIPDPNTCPSFTALYQCKEKNGNRFLLSNTCDPSSPVKYEYHGGTREKALEGYVYSPCGPPQSNPLYLWTDGNGSYATSGKPPEGYKPEHVKLLGYMPSLSELAEISSW